jgi:hypothetical protein
MHEVWRSLLDEEFLHAFCFGFVVRCHDGIERRIYPRIFTYSVDYPEKCNFLSSFAVTFMAHFIVRVLLATIQDQGLCPCPRCLVPKSKLDQVGRITDTKNRINKVRVYPVDAVNKARQIIYDQGIPITGAAVQWLLKDTFNSPDISASMLMMSLSFLN